MKWLVFIFMAVMMMGLVSASDFAYNNINKGILSDVTSAINYTTVNVNNSQFWDGHNWNDISDYYLENTNDTFSGLLTMNNGYINFTGSGGAIDFTGTRVGIDEDGTGILSIRGEENRPINILPYDNGGTVQITNKGTNAYNRALLSIFSQDSTPDNDYHFLDIVTTSTADPYANFIRFRDAGTERFGVAHATNGNVLFEVDYAGNVNATAYFGNGSFLTDVDSDYDYNMTIAGNYEYNQTTYLISTYGSFWYNMTTPFTNWLSTFNYNYNQSMPYDDYNYNMTDGYLSDYDYNMSTPYDDFNYNMTVSESGEIANNLTNYDDTAEVYYDSTWGWVTKG